MSNKIKQYIFLISRELFFFSSLAWLIFFILEVIWPQIVLAYFNLNYLLLLCLLSGLFSLFFNRKNKDQLHKE
ncbi:MAG: hypothetical protein MUF50_01125 [Planctomycetes bacterium]|jgi:hypothetical protein|nr:hypothetical protein [Planctomycetota bacterium]